MLADSCALKRLREGLVRPKMKKEQRECLGDVWSEGGDDTEHRGVLGRPRGDMVLRMSILSWTHSGKDRSRTLKTLRATFKTPTSYSMYDASYNPLRHSFPENKALAYEEWARRMSGSKSGS